MGIIKCKRDVSCRSRPRIFPLRDGSSTAQEGGPCSVWSPTVLGDTSIEGPHVTRATVPQEGESTLKPSPSLARTAVHTPNCPRPQPHILRNFQPGETCKAMTAMPLSGGPSTTRLIFLSAISLPAGGGYSLNALAPARWAEFTAQAPEDFFLWPSSCQPHGPARVEPVST